VRLDLGSSGQIEAEHDEGHKQQHAGEDGEVGNGDGDGDDGGQNDQAVDAWARGTGGGEQMDVSAEK
jgi:hypothetical protein